MTTIPRFFRFAFWIVVCSLSASLGIAAPSITSIDPSTGITEGGTTITINGSGFGSSSSLVTVILGGATMPLVTVSDTRITASTPAGEGTGKQVIVFASGQVSNSVTFSYLPPSISSISPSTVSTSGGTLITLTGSNFGLVPAVTSGTTSLTISSRNHTSIVCAAPSGQGTNTPIVVTTGGQVSNSASIAYSPPSISSISPAAGTTAGGTIITITGSNFGTSSIVGIGGRNAQVLGNTHTQLVVSTPAGEGANQAVRVNTSGQISNAVSFNYDAPTISSITPATADTAGGGTITVTGSDFGLAPKVSFNGNQINPDSFTHTQAIFTLPAGEGTNLPVTLSAGGQTSNSLPFGYNPPSITSISPSSGVTQGGDTITIHGANFGLTGSVTIGGQSAPVTSGGASHTQLIVTSPAGQGSGQPVVVTVLDRASNAANFDYNAPQITSISAISAPTSGGTVITLKGSNFGLSGSVFIGGKNAPVTSNGYTHSSVTCTLPAGQGANVPVVVTSAGRSSNTASLSYDGPSITSVSPSTGPTSGGSLITLTGSNFGTSPEVSFNGSSLTPESSTHSQVIFSLPPEQGSNLPVRVSAGGQLSAASSFTYTAPVLTGISATSYPTAGGTTITLTGSNFGVSRTVRVGTSNATVIPAGSGHSQIVCTLPAGEGTQKPVTVSVAGAESNALLLDYDAPEITSIDPGNGPTQGGSVITITGKNFGLSGTASIGGQDAPVTSGGASHNQLIVTCPAGQGSGNPVAVTVLGRTSNTVSFAYNPPVLTGISATSYPTAGGTTITLTGSNFGVSRTVRVGTSNATVVPAGSGHSQIVCTLPAGEGTQKPVTVTVSGADSNALLLDYDAPEITSIDPGNGPTQGGSIITITGKNFGLSGTASIGGQATTIPPGGSVSHTQLVVATPAGQGSGKPVVVKVLGRSSNAVNFDYNAPQISSITSSSAPTSGGTRITINGSNFGLSGTVLIGGQNAPITFNGYGHDQITCRLPAGQGTDLPVTVTSVGRTSNTALFSYDAPVITQVSPASATTSGGVLLTLQGRNFGMLNRSVRFGGQVITQLASATHDEIVCTLPSGQGSNVPIQVSVDGRLSAATSFAYLPPVLSSITPSSGPTSGGTRITLKGSDFGVFPVVSIGGNIAPLAVPATHTMLEVDLPAGEGADLTVVVSAGDQASIPLRFDYLPPSITSISPAVGPTSGAVPITINGSNFGLSPVVRIGGKSAPNLSAGHNRIIVTLPAGGGSGKQVTVTTAGQASNAALFDYDGDTFANWSESIAWNGLDSSAGADPRHTGWKNCLAYALGVDPTTATGGEIASRVPPVHGMPVVSRDATGRLQVTFWRRRGGSSPDLVYQVQFAGSLDGGTWDGPAPDPQVEVVDSAWEFCTFTDAAPAGSRRFSRLKVELASPP